LLFIGILPGKRETRGHREAYQGISTMTSALLVSSMHFRCEAAGLPKGFTGQLQMLQGAPKRDGNCEAVALDPRSRLPRPFCVRRCWCRFPQLRTVSASPSQNNAVLFCKHVETPPQQLFFVVAGIQNISANFLLDPRSASSQSLCSSIAMP
jgi:hypothetical protein